MNEDIRQSKPRLCTELVFWPDRSGDQIGYRIEVPSRCKFFRIGYTEFVFIHALDGNTTVAQACGRVAKLLRRDALSPTQADAIVRWLIQNDLIERSAPVSPASDEPRPAAQWLDRLNPFWLKLPLPNVQSWIHPVASLMQWVFSLPLVLMACATMFIGAIAIGMQIDRFLESSATIVSPHRWIGILASWVFLKVLHELGHAAAAARYGCPIHKAGIVFVLFAPLAYVDVTSSLRLRSRMQRIMIAVAGMYVELTIASAAAILWCVVDSPWISDQLFNIIVTASVATILFNANPLMRFDGYYILADLLRIPNLATEGSRAVGDLATRCFYARSTRHGTMTGWRGTFIVVYGIAAMVWRVVVCVSLSIAAWWMFDGLGILLVGIGLVTWIGRPTLARLRSWNQRRRLDPHAALRAAVIAGGFVLVGSWVLFGMPLSTAVRAPAVVDVSQGAILRSRADGFVRSLAVRDGASVTVGDVIMQLENDELRVRHLELQSKIAQSRVRQRQATDSRDIAAVQIQRSDRRTLEKQLAQVQTQIDGLTVRAHRRGRIIAPRIDDLIGTFVREGDDLLTVSDPSERRVIASIAGADIRQASAQIGNRVHIRAASGHTTTGILENIKPLASYQLRHESLASPSGGELAVQVDSEAESGNRGYKLLEPRFEAAIRMEHQSGSLLPMGQTVRVAVGRRTQTVAWRLRLWMESLFRAAKPQPTTPGNQW